MLKRSFDIVIAVVAIVLLAPFFCLVAILIRLNMGAPVLFKQLRPGMDGKSFMMLKFRTMRDAYGPDGQILSDGERLTKLGKFFRSTSLDELPELWNVFTGEMSLVGPRPLLMEYLPLYSPEQMRRHEVRPGVTGWAQVNGRNALSWEDKFALDVWYVDHQSFWLDMRILLLTIGKVVKREGISGAGEATMSRFEGSKP
ncbi:sugar transferase [Sphingorhabdus pulchriflava]|uniref:Sugar transferase n=1 Tax=Sphingorhabdus pulchriflava TaxID=2292257 RepID=A0A371B1J9_9SPHN|nr:sugar transferase [Sphingorhabdus pulchriflava]RDV01466.1 sugar transferase [Sphingorhabdus pulchriflava]